MRSLLFIITILFATSSFAETRCGWIHNPTPGNGWLVDADGLWIISTQGSHQAEGELQYPHEDQFVNTNRTYGYFCGCIDILKADSENKILKFNNASAKLIKTCLKDENLPGPK